MAEQKRSFLSSQGTEVNKNSTSYTSVVSPLKKKKKKKKKTKKKEKKKNKERVWGQTKPVATSWNSVRRIHVMYMFYVHWI